MPRQGFWLLRVAVRGLLLAGTSGILLAGAAGAGAAQAVTGTARAGAAQTGPAQAVTGTARAGTAQTGPAQTGPAQTGPAQINALARPDLCWQAGGNGALVTLARCDSALQAQQWTLTSDGVLMTGTGYCLEAADGPLFIDFADQCGGSAGQRWQFSGATGALTSTGTGICAVAGGPLVPGTGVVRATCTAATSASATSATSAISTASAVSTASAASATAATGPAASDGGRWSFGYSAVTVTAGSGHGLAGGAFTASMTVANAAPAQAAYGVSMRLGLPRGVTLSAFRGTGGAAGWRCDVRALTCSGDLAAGDAERVGISGRLPATARRGTVVDVSAGVSVAGTSQSPGTSRAAVPVRVTVLAAAPPAVAGRADRPGVAPACSSRRSPPGPCCSAAACWLPWPGGPRPGEARNSGTGNTAARNRPGRTLSRRTNPTSSM